MKTLFNRGLIILISFKGQYLWQSSLFWHWSKDSHFSFNNFTWLWAFDLHLNPIYKYFFSWSNSQLEHQLLKLIHKKKIQLKIISWLDVSTKLLSSQIKLSIIQNTCPLDKTNYFHCITNLALCLTLFIPKYMSSRQNKLLLFIMSVNITKGAILLWRYV